MKDSIFLRSCLTEGFWFKMIRFGVYCFVGVATLRMVVVKAGLSNRATVMVYTTVPDVDILIDGTVYPVGKLTSYPVVQELPIGEHHIQMARWPEVLFEQTILVTGREKIMIMARPPELGPEEKELEWQEPSNKSILAKVAESAAEL